MRTKTMTNTESPQKWEVHKTINQQQKTLTATQLKQQQPMRYRPENGQQLNWLHWFKLLYSKYKSHDDETVCA